MRLYLQKEITRAKWTVIEHLLCKWEALSSNPSPTKNNNNNTKKKRERERERRKGTIKYHAAHRSHLLQGLICSSALMED
jgi:hypothetical protein